MKIKYLVLLFLIAIFQCTTEQDKQERQAASKQPKQLKIVTLGGVITETVAALGFEEQIVAIDRTSSYPASLQSLPNLGFGNAISMESIMQTSPDLVLGLKSVVSDNLAQQLKASGIAYHLFEQEFSKEGSKRLFKELGDALEAYEHAEVLIDRFEREMQSLQEVEPQELVFIYARGQGAMQVAGKDTPADAFFKLAGHKNAITEFEGFKPLSPEALMQANPQALVFFDTGLQSLGGAENLDKIPGISETRAGRGKKAIAMDGLMMLGFGPRLPAALTALQQNLAEKQ